MIRSSVLSVAALALVAMASASRAADSTPAPAGDFLAQQGGDLWRASKLVGVNVYGPGNQKVGDINDVLMTKEGKASYVVIGVGGFLGIGEKDVAIPFDRVSFSQEPMAAAAGAQPVATGLGTPAQTNGPGTGATMVPGTTTNGTAATMTPAAPPVAPRSTAYPDHGTVSYTADQLKAAPTFSFAK